MCDYDARVMIAKSSHLYIYIYIYCNIDGSNDIMRFASNNPGSGVGRAMGMLKVK